MGKITTFKLMVRAFVLSTIFVIGVSAQSVPNAQLIEEFGKITLDDLMARLDAIAPSMQVGYGSLLIRIYGGDGKSYMSPYLMGGNISSYLVKNRGVSSEKFEIEYCNLNNETLRVQIFNFTRKTPVNKCAKNPNPPKDSILFANMISYLDGHSLDAVEETTPYIGETNGEYSIKSLKILQQFLDESPESKIYAFLILGKTLEDDQGNGKRKVDKKSDFRKMRLIAREVLLKNGIESSRIKFVEAENFNEYQKYEFWFVPKGGEIPKPKPANFPKKQK